MADTKNLLFLGAAGAAVWYFFLRNPPGLLGSNNPPVSSTIQLPPVGTTGTAPIVTAPATDTTNTLAGVFGKMVAASGVSGSGTLGADGWDYYLNQVLSPLGYTAPDPLPLFSPSTGGWDRSTPYTAAQYWAVVGPAIKQQTGLSGLGFFGGSGLRGWVQ